MDFAALRSELDDLAGLDLSTTERDRLLNEGARELAIRAEWTRKTANIGPTVVDQAAYALPADLDRILRLSVNGEPYVPNDEEDAENLTLGDRSLSAYGAYRLTWDSLGAEKVSLYPVPSTAGLAVNLLYVYEPADMSNDTDEPKVPKRFRRAIADYAKAEALSGSEEDLESHAYYKARFEEKVQELSELRVKREGRSARQVRIVGYSA